MTVASGNALVCRSNCRATATRAAGPVGHDASVADGFGDGAGLGVMLGLTVGVGVGFGVRTTVGGELLVLAGVGATGPRGPEGDADAVGAGGADGEFAAVFVLALFDVTAPATATAAIAATAAPRISSVALRELMRDRPVRRPCGRRTGFWCTEPA